MVYQISTTQFDSKFRVVDIHAVKLNGKLAYQMNLADLHREAKRAGIPRIEPGMGVQDVVLRIGVHQLEQFEKAGACNND